MESPIIRQLQSKNAVIAVTVVCGALLLLSLATLALEVRDVTTARNAPIEDTRPAARTRAADDFKVNEIVSAHLMGNPARARPVRVERAPTTKLNLTLKGLLSTHDQTIARAVIAVGKKNDKLYAVGDKLESGNAVVKEIRIDQVLLDRNGKVESLPLPKKLTSDNIGKDALYVPPADELPETAAVNSGVSESSAGPTEPPTRRGAQEPNFSGLDRALERMGAGSRALQPPEGEVEGEPED